MTRSFPYPKSVFPSFPGIWFPLIAVILAFPTSDVSLLLGKFLIFVMSLLSSLSMPIWNKNFFWLFLLLLLPYSSLVWSVGQAHTLDGAIQITYYAVCFIILRSLRFHGKDVLWGLRILVAASCIPGVEGVRQLVFGYDIPSEAAPVIQSWVNALSGRVFSTFSLPSQFAGYLLMLLPLNVVLISLENNKLVKRLWAVFLIWNGVLFFYTKSFGAWVSLFIVLMLGLLLWYAQKRRITLVFLLTTFAGFLLGGGGMLFLIGYARGHYLWNLSGNNPLWYRLLNWKTALEMFRDHLFLGTGFRTFGVMYPQYMQPGANESQFVHNTYLQFGAELGLMGFLAVTGCSVFWFSQSWVRLRHGILPSKGNVSSHDHTRVFVGIASFLGGCGFLLHNGIDFDFYVFPLGIFGISLLGLTGNMLALSASDEEPERHHSSILRIVTIILLCGVLLPVFVWDSRNLYAREQQEQALISLKSNEHHEALSAIANAREAVSAPEYAAFQAQIWLSLHQYDSALKGFYDAIQAQPDTPWFHSALADTYFRKHNLSMAYLESRQAAELFPFKDAYQQQTKLIQNGLLQLR